MTDPDADVATVRAHLPNAYRDAHEALDNILAALRTAQQEREQERELWESRIASRDELLFSMEKEMKTGLTRGALAARLKTAEQRILTLEGALKAAHTLLDAGRNTGEPRILIGVVADELAAALEANHDRRVRRPRSGEGGEAQ